jgi:transcriptional regulator with XRE-family HTH domain
MVSAYERGERNPSLRTLDRLVAAAGWRLVIGIERGGQFMDGMGRITRAGVAAALGSVALEGGAVSDELAEALDDVAEGRRDLKEVLAETVARHARSVEAAPPTP